MTQVIYCPVHKGLKGALIEGTMDDLKWLVGGEVELLHVLPGIMAAVNEHYVELDLPVNPWIHRGAYNGTVVFVGSPRRNTPYRELNPADLAALCNAGILNRAELDEACYEPDAIREIEKAWAKWNEQRSAGAEADLDRQTARLPDNVWLH